MTRQIVSWETIRVTIGHWSCPQCFCSNNQISWAVFCCPSYYCYLIFVIKLAEEIWRVRRFIHPLGNRIKRFSLCTSRISLRALSVDGDARLSWRFNLLLMKSCVGSCRKWDVFLIKKKYFKRYRFHVNTVKVSQNNPWRNSLGSLFRNPSLKETCA